MLLAIPEQTIREIFPTNFNNTWYDLEATIAAANARSAQEEDINPIDEGFAIVGEPRTYAQKDHIKDFQILLRITEELKMPICFACKSFSKIENAHNNQTNHGSDAAHWIFIHVINKENVLVINPLGNTSNISREIMREVTQACGSHINIYHSTLQTQEDGHSCGPITAELMRIFRRKYTKNPQQLIAYLQKNAKEDMSVDTTILFSPEELTLLTNGDCLRRSLQERRKASSQSIIDTPEQALYRQLRLDSNYEQGQEYKLQQTKHYLQLLNRALSISRDDAMPRANNIAIRVNRGMHREENITPSNKKRVDVRPFNANAPQARLLFVAALFGALSIVTGFMSVNGHTNSIPEQTHKLSSSAFVLPIFIVSLVAFFALIGIYICNCENPQHTLNESSINSKERHQHQM